MKPKVFNNRFILAAIAARMLTCSTNSATATDNSTATQTSKVKATTAVTKSMPAIVRKNSRPSESAIFDLITPNGIVNIEAASMLRIEARRQSDTSAPVTLMANFIDNRGIVVDHFRVTYPRPPNGTALADKVVPNDTNRVVIMVCRDELCSLAYDAIMLRIQPPQAGVLNFEYDPVTKTLVWSAGPKIRRCEAVGNWSGQKSVRGSEQIAGAGNYRLVCTTSDGEMVSKITEVPPKG
ncbi:MAG TPA: hypothetical protein VJB98_00320 [Candidatus Paceibacterota bacterium]